MQADHVDARPLPGRDLSAAIRAAEPEAAPQPVLFTTDDEISEGRMPPKGPVQRVARSFGPSQTSATNASTDPKRPP